MAKPKSKAEAEKTSDLKDDTYFQHNDATAIIGPEEKQCQCQDCKDFRSAKE